MCRPPVEIRIYRLIYQNKGVGKDEGVDVSRARHEWALGGLAAPLMPRKGALWEQTAVQRT